MILVKQLYKLYFMWKQLVVIGTQLFFIRKYVLHNVNDFLKKLIYNQ